MLPPWPLPSIPPPEERIDRKIDQGRFREPAEVLARALDLLDENQSRSSGELEELKQHLSASLASADRGELYTGEQARQILAERRAQRRMNGYRLTGEAIGDLEEITQALADREGWDRSMKVEQELFDAFDKRTSLRGSPSPSILKPNSAFSARSIGGSCANLPR